MDNQDTNDLLLGTSREVKQSSKEGGATEQKTSLKETQFYTDALNENNINNIIINQKPELIVLFGLNDLGKTTFVGSFYHLFKVNGEMADYKFVNSDTFAGFERRVFLRKCNKEGRSITNRTNRSENPFLTLHLESVKSKEKRLIVLSDRAGERYRDYISKDEELLKDKTIKHANRILLFVNAEELVERTYSSMKDDLLSLLRRLKVKGMLPISAQKYIIFNKYDKVSNPESEKFIERTKEIVDLFEEMFESKNIPHYFINSKSLDNNIELENLFYTLVEPLNVKNIDPALDWVTSSIKKNRT